MKKILLIGLVFILLISFASAGDFTDDYTYPTLNLNTNGAEWYGSKVTINEDDAKQVVLTRASGDLGTNCSIVDPDTKAILNTSNTFTSDECTLDYNFVNGDEYYFLITRASSTAIKYGASFSHPVNSTSDYFTITHRASSSDQGGTYAELETTNPASLQKIEVIFGTNATPTTPTDITFNPSTIYANTNMTVNASGSTDADNDTITYYYKFYDVNDTSILKDWSTDNHLQLTSTQAHNDIQVYTKASDLNTNSSEYSETIKVSNTLPTTPTGLTYATSPFYVGDTITLTGSGSTDTIDSDSLTYQYKIYNQNDSITVQDWSTNNTYVIQGTDNLDTLLLYTRTYDGYGYSSSKTNSTYVVGATVDLRLTNEYDGTNIDIFSLTFANGTTLNTINNSIVFQTSEGTETFTLNSTGFISRTFNDYVIDAEIDLTLYEALVELTATEKITGTTINSFSVTDGVYYTETTNGTAKFYADADSYTLTINATNYFSEDYNINLSSLEETTLETDLGNVNLTLKAFESGTGSPINNFTIVATLDDYTENKTTINGELDLYLIQDNWTISIFSDGYSSENIELELNNLNESYNFSLYVYRAFILNFYDEISREEINNATIDIEIAGDNFYNYTSIQLINESQTNITLLLPDFYRINYKVEGYEENNYYSSISLESITNLSLYSLKSSTDPSLLELNVIESTDFTEYSGLIIAMQRLYIGDGIWATVQMQETGEFGKAFFDVEELDTDYRFIFKTKSGNVLKTSAKYIFSCTGGFCESTSSVSNSSVDTVSPELSIIASSSSSENSTINWTDPLGENHNVIIEVNQLSRSGIFNICSESQTGASGSVTCNLSGVSGEIQIVAYVDGKLNSGLWERFSTPILPSIFGEQEGGFWVLAIGLTISMMGLFSAVGAVIFTIVGLIVAFLLGLSSALDITIIIIAGVIGIIIATRLKR